MDVFDEAEAREFLTTRFVAMRRPTDAEALDSLTAEVGLVPQRLALAAGYLQKSPVVSA